jgi:DNA polymerase-3 subunit delta'
VVVLFNVVGQEFSKEAFKNALHTGRVSHAYIVQGPDGVGKSIFALYMASSILCSSEQKPCGLCSSCLKISHGNHPDLKTISGKNKTIGVDDIRYIIDEIYTKPYEGDKKVVIIKNAENITMYGQNAILKTLEEPIGHTVIIMLTENINAILDTIKSRCQTFRFGRIPIEKIKNFLISQGVEENRAEVAANFSDGIVGNALKALDSKFMEMRKNIIDIARKIVRGNSLEAFELVSFFVDNKDNIDEILDILTIWFRDIMLTKLAKDRSLIINRDLQEMIVEESRMLSYNKLKNILDVIKDTKEKINQNTNFQLSMEVMILKIQEA